MLKRTYIGPNTELDDGSSTNYYERLNALMANVVAALAADATGVVVESDNGATSAPRIITISIRGHGHKYRLISAAASSYRNINISMRNLADTSDIMQINTLYTNNSVKATTLNVLTTDTMECFSLLSFSAIGGYLKLSDNTPLTIMSTSTYGILCCKTDTDNVWRITNGEAGFSYATSDGKELLIPARVRNHNASIIEAKPTGVWRFGNASGLPSGIPLRDTEGKYYLLGSGNYLFGEV